TPVLGSEKELYSVARHDARAAEVARRLAVHYRLNEDMAAFIALSHDASALPFRHYATQGPFGQILKDARFNPKQALIERLESLHLKLSETTKNDILNFDINKNPQDTGITAEAQLAL